MKTLARYLFLVWLIINSAPFNLKAQTIGLAQSSEVQNSEYIEISQKRLLTIIVTNRNSAKPPHQPYYATIINQVPRPVCWLDGRTYKGLTNVSFFPTPPTGVWLKIGADSVWKQITSQTWQCEPRPYFQWEWRIHCKSGEEAITTAKYQIVTATRRLRTEKLHLLLPDLKDLPPDIQASTARLKASLPQEVTVRAHAILGKEDSLVTIVEKISDWTRAHVLQKANDLSGKFITRYNIWPGLRENRGWCGPRSSVFRALCAAYGIPAREVSGYDLQNLDHLVGEDINGRNAHVWAEVYLPHVGWVEVNVANLNPFFVPASHVPTYGIETPISFAVNEQGIGIPSEESQKISVTSVEIP